MQTGPRHDGHGPGYFSAGDRYLVIATTTHQHDASASFHQHFEDLIDRRLAHFPNGTILRDHRFASDSEKFRMARERLKLEAARCQLQPFHSDFTIGMDLKVLGRPHFGARPLHFRVHSGVVARKLQRFCVANGAEREGTDCAGVSFFDKSAIPFSFRIGTFAFNSLLELGSAECCHLLGHRGHRGLVFIWLLSHGFRSLLVW